MKNDFIITLAWPEGMVKAAGAWYDKILSKKGKYRAGHSAIVLINSEKQKSHYFDFGRYHTPKGYGRVRDMETDPDLAVIDPIIEEGKIINMQDILIQLSEIKAIKAEGKMYASLISKVSFEKGFAKAKKIQKKEMLAYGPFVINGTNCSRFVSKIIKSSEPSWLKVLRLKYPFCISPSPKRNVCISNHHYYVVENKNCIKVKKNKLKAYFSSIEQR
tara:strand:+ start:250 stop:900 length:651 start_codon:yes stop_codon:yes gene_type:complete